MKKEEKRNEYEADNPEGRTDAEMLETGRYEESTSYLFSHQQVAVEKHRNRLLSRRPGERPPRKKMEMKMKYGLTSTAPIIDYYSKAVRPQTLLICNGLGNVEEMSYACVASSPHAVNIGDMALRNNEDVDRCLRMVVFKGKCCLVLIHDFGRDLLLNDFAEEAILNEAHRHLSPFVEKLLKKQLLDPVWQAGPV